MILASHLLRRINVIVTAVHQLKPFYSEIGRPSVDSELMIRTLVGYCAGIGSERKLCDEVAPSRSAPPRRG